MKSAIITGATGFIGKSVVHELISNGITVYAFARNLDLLEKHPLVKPISYSLENGISIENEIILKNKKIDVFYHFAWDGYIGESRSNAKLQLENIQYTLDALNMASRLNCHKFIGAGSIMEQESIQLVYNTHKEVPLSTTYGSAKVTAHLMSKALASSLSIEYIWPFITNTYGVGEISPRFINSTLRKIINKEDLNFTSAQQNYDFIYITDLAKAYHLIGEKGKANRKYAIGSGSAQPLKNFILKMISATSYPKTPIFGGVSFDGVQLPLKEYSIDILQTDTKFLPEVTFEEGILQTQKWLERMIYNG